MIPEVVCDILCYMGNYYHYYTPLYPFQTYKALMDAQIKNKSIATIQQTRLVEESGWRYSERGLNKQVEKLNLENLRREINGKPQEQIVLECNYNLLKKK